jgi:hypothetical protein
MFYTKPMQRSNTLLTLTSIIAIKLATQSIRSMILHWPLPANSPQTMPFSPVNLFQLTAIPSSTSSSGNQIKSYASSRKFPQKTIESTNKSSHPTKSASKLPSLPKNSHKPLAGTSFLPLLQSAQLSTSKTWTKPPKSISKFPWGGT